MTAALAEPLSDGSRGSSLSEQLAVAHMDMARKIARRARRIFATANADLGELESLAFMGLAQAAIRFDPTRGVPFAGYASRRVWGAIYDQYRRRKFRDESHEPLPEDLVDPASEDLYDGLEVRDPRLRQCTDGQLRVLVLHVVRGMTIQEVAGVLGVQTATVHRQLQRALARARQRPRRVTIA